jgi:hypothetical protein
MLFLLFNCRFSSAGLNAAAAAAATVSLSAELAFFQQLQQQQHQHQQNRRSQELQNSQTGLASPYRLHPTYEHLYSSLHSSPVASLRGLSPLEGRSEFEGEITPFSRNTFFHAILIDNRKTELSLKGNP